MSSTVPFPPPGFDELSPGEQADYAGDLWDYVVPRVNDTDDIPEWHKEILDERMARYRETGVTGITIDELEKELSELLT